MWKPGDVIRRKDYYTVSGTLFCDALFHIISVGGIEDREYEVIEVEEDDEPQIKKGWISIDFLNEDLALQDLHFTIEKINV